MSVLITFLVTCLALAVGTCGGIAIERNQRRSHERRQYSTGDIAYLLDLAATQARRIAELVAERDKLQRIVTLQRAYLAQSPNERAEAAESQ